ncbi:DnaJ-domain-containing protein [Lophium mytilinum]|uniref:DnaJ-domain-containing protein n=1 Tax=Lophium mytilinum TaxID=390894 RepID=A0A6A6RA82_9PEZI|nr:DnaJ-domain-containing protein [Lophium mytilinum]
MSSNPVFKTHYAALSVRADATKEAIRQAYRRLVLIYHPDKLRSDLPEAQKATAVAMFRGVQEAYEILSDDEKRAKYDARRSGQAQGFTREYFNRDPFTRDRPRRHRGKPGNKPEETYEPKESRRWYHATPPAEKKPPKGQEKRKPGARKKRSKVPKPPKEVKVTPQPAQTAEPAKKGKKSSPPAFRDAQ